MKKLRWVISFPGAMIASFVVWALTQQAFSGVAATYRGGLFRSVIGMVPIIISAAFPTVIFVTIATLLSPSQGRKAAFVFFGLSLLFSAGGLELLQNQDFNHVFWLTAALGVVIGGIVGLAVTLKIQRWRNQKQASVSGLV